MEHTWLCICTSPLYLGFDHKEACAIPLADLTEINTAHVQADLDYTKLRDLLAEGKFQDADDETRALLIKLAGPGAVDRKWVYFSEVRIPILSPQP